MRSIALLRESGQNGVNEVRVIEEKCNKSKKAKFDSEGLIKLFLSKLELSEDDIKSIKGVISDEEYRNLMTREFYFKHEYH